MYLTKDCSGAINDTSATVMNTCFDDNEDDDGTGSTMMVCSASGALPAGVAILALFLAKILA